MSILSKKTKVYLTQMRKDLAPHIIELWDAQTEGLARPKIPRDWTPWPDVSEIPEVGTRDRSCFFNSKLVNREWGLPLILGVYFNKQTVLSLLHEKDVEMPSAHAVNLGHNGEIVDVTWGQVQMVGIMVGRPFAVAPTSNLKAYVSQFGFLK